MLYAKTGGIKRVRAAGGEPEDLVVVDRSETAFRPQLLPGGRAVLFTVTTITGRAGWDRARIVVQPLDGGERSTLIDGGTDGRYLPSGHLLYASSGVVFARQFDPERLRLTGAAVPVIDGVRRDLGATGSATAHVGVSETGTLVYLPGPPEASTGALRLALFDRSGAAEPLPLPPGQLSAPRVSPDGRMIAFGLNDGQDESLWIYELAGGGAARRLTFGGRDRYPVWAADSRRVVFQSERGGDAALYWQRADGTSAAERLTKAEKDSEHIPHSASPDGAVLLVDERNTERQGALTARSRLMLFSLGDRTLKPFGDVESFRPTGATFSPDGRWVAYTMRDDPSRANRVLIQPFPPTGARYQVSPAAEDGHHPLWSSDGKEVFYTPGPGERLMVVAVSTATGFAYGPPTTLSRTFLNSPSQLERPYDAVRGGSRLLALSTELDSSVDRRIHVVLNWFEELRSRAAGQ